MSRLVVPRLIAPVVFLGALVLLTAGWAAWYVRHTRSAAADVANSVASVRAAQELEISIREVRTQLDRYLISGERKHLAPVPRLRERTAAALAEAEEAAATPEEVLLMQRTRQGYAHFLEEYDRAMHSPPAQGLYLSLTDLTDTVLTKEILAPAHEYLRLNEGMLARSARANQGLAAWLTSGLIALAVCGSLGGVLVGWAFAAAVGRSIRETEERLRQTERDALRAERLAMVGQMAAGIAHEVRNPLMTIKMLVQSAADRSAGLPFVPRELAVLEEEIGRLEQIVAGFLDFARPPRPAMRPVDLAGLVAEAADGLRARGELQAVRLEVSSGPTGVIHADPNQVRQVVYNLMINALDAQPGGGEVRVRVGADGADAVLTVADSGPGLPPELGERIFDPFVGTKESGMGLGLSICRRIVEAHAGTLRAESEPRGGARFVVRFPARPA